MPLQKMVFKPGVDRENTRYTSEGGWYDCDKVRFRRGMPEKLGGWNRISTNSFLGVARSLFSWVTLGSQKLLGVGTNLKFYIEQGGTYYDITPIRAAVSLTDPFTTVSGSTTVTVTDANGGYKNNDFVTFSGASAVGGLTLNGEFQITYLTGNTYTITASEAASSSASGGGSVTATYQINSGPAVAEALVGWGAAGWGLGPWNTGITSTDALRLWSQSNFGEDLIFAARGGSLFFWDATDALTTRGVLLSSESGASNVPTIVNTVLVSDNRFVFCFGTNVLGSSNLDPMLLRWSDQESAVNWTPSATNQAGDLRLSKGSEIITAIQGRQEILVWTDSALYALQYVGAPAVWGAQTVGENLSIASPNTVAYANGVAYWMGVGGFYLYDGRVQTLPCTLKRYVFNDFNTEQYDQVFAGTNEGFSEIWWFYCSSGATTIDRYVIYNYEQNIWYFGNLGRTAWIDSGIRDFPMAATYNNNVVNHEDGIDDNETGTAAGMSSFISSAQFDLDDGHRFAFIQKVYPDVTFDGSTVDSPSATLSLFAAQNSGSGRNSPASEGGTNTGSITRTATAPIEAFTSRLDLRVRGRQLALKIESSDLGVKWQLGSPRLEMRPDGRR